jgi:hypothetical protein
MIHVQFFLICCVAFIVISQFIIFPKLKHKSNSPNKLRVIENTWTPPRNVKQFEDCDVECYYDRSMPLVGRKVVFDKYGRSSTFMHTMEGPKHYPRTVTKGPYDGLSTVSMDSDIPLPYFSWAEYNIKTPAINYDDAIKGGVFIARNCRSLNNREGLIREVQKYMRLDSISSCLNNAPWPADISRSDKNSAMRRYLFYFALENECSDDYMTEKLWGALGTGTLPIYYGAPNVLKYVPPNSIVDVNQYANSNGEIDYESLGEFLNELANDKERYMEYHKWRDEYDYPEDFKRIYDFTHIHNICRCCRWNIARHEPEKYKFEHKTQKLIKF